MATECRDREIILFSGVTLIFISVALCHFRAFTKPSLGLIEQELTEEYMHIYYTPRRFYGFIPQSEILSITPLHIEISLRLLAGAQELL
jgi:hypothetical protein